MQIEFSYSSGNYFGNVTPEQVGVLVAKIGQLLPFSFEEIPSGEDSY
jgi:hypothetical protein